MSEPSHVLDASALLALMRGEPGGDAVAALLATAVIGAVNLSEVVAKLQERGVPDAIIDESLADLDLHVIPFDREQAMRAGKLRQATRSLGLSFGDRACLATAGTLGAVAITTDRDWARLEIGIDIALARS